MNELNKTPYEALIDLNAAKQHPDGTVVLEGDYGGIIYATCPAKYVEADHDEISTLCKWLENRFWKLGEVSDEIKKIIGEGGWGVYYEVAQTGSNIWGGMKGGKVIDGLWTHPKLDDTLTSQISLQLKVDSKTRIRNEITHR